MKLGQMALMIFTHSYLNTDLVAYLASFWTYKHRQALKITPIFFNVISTSSLNCEQSLNYNVKIIKLPIPYIAVLIYYLIWAKLFLLQMNSQGNKNKIAQCKHNIYSIIVVNKSYHIIVT